MKAANELAINPEIRRLADEVTNIRNQLWILTDEMSMTRRQYDSLEVVKDRLWRVQDELRNLAPKIENPSF